MPEAGFPTRDDPRTRHLRQFFLLVVTVSCLAMIPWVAYLAAVLPVHHPAQQWNVAWVGFDVLLIGGLAATAAGAWMKRQFVVVAAVFTATLLCCDAWFDISLDWGTPDGTASILSAAFGELPLAAYLFAAALGMIRLTIRTALLVAGYTGPIPPFHKISTLGLQELVATTGGHDTAA